MTTAADTPQRPRRSRLILLPVVALPLIEIFLISTVGSALGAGPTLLLLLAGVILGGLVIRYAGRRALTTLRTASTDPTTTAGTDLTRTAGDAGLIILAGVLLIIPGFLTDALGLLLLIPFVRGPLRKLIAGQVLRRTKLGTAFAQARDLDEQLRMRRPDGRVVPGEVVEEHDEPFPKKNPFDNGRIIQG